MPSDNPAVVGNQYWIVETKTFEDAAICLIWALL
jgi:hypothetical protein